MYIQGIWETDPFCEILCPGYTHYTLLYHWPKVSREANRPGSWLMEMESRLLRHFGTVTYHFTKRSLNVGHWRILTDWPAENELRKNMKSQLSITKGPKIFWLTWERSIENNKTTCFPYSSSHYFLNRNVVSHFVQYHLFNKYLLNNYYVKGTFLCARG